MWATASVGGWAWWRCRARVSLPTVGVRLQLRDELIGEVHGHAADAGLYAALPELFGGDAPRARDEAFTMKAMHQGRRRRVSSGTKLGSPNCVRLRDGRPID